jgi:hypothetical protein
MNVTERLQALVETANDIITVYHQNMGNKNITAQLRNVLADNILLLESMMHDANNLALFDQTDPDIIKLSDDLFVVFNEAIMENIKIFHYLFKIT